MTQAEIITLLNSLKTQVETNTAEIRALSLKLSDYVKKTDFATVKNTSSENSTQIKALTDSVAAMETSIGFVNKLEKLIDVNVSNLTLGDTIRFDGDRWTNYNLDNMIGGSAAVVTTLRDLTDVDVTNLLQDGQALCYDAVSGKWVNTTVSTSGSGGSFDALQMWQELATESGNVIHPSHIGGAITVESITTTDGATLQSGDVVLNVNDELVHVTGNIAATEGVAALKEYEA